MSYSARLCAAWVLALLPFAQAAASTTGWGNVSSAIFLNFASSGYAFFSHDGTRTTAPACATIPGRFVIGPGSGGKLQVAALLTAKAMNKRIMVVGTGDCSDWPDSESVNYFVVED